MADVRVWRLGREQHLSLSSPSLHVAQEQEAFPCSGSSERAISRCPMTDWHCDRRGLAWSSVHRARAMRLGYSLRIGWPVFVANKKAVAAMTLPARIARVDPTGDDLRVPCLVFGIGEDTPFHPESPFAIAPSAIRALFRLEVVQILKTRIAASCSVGELDNAGTHQMGNLLVSCGGSCATGRHCPVRSLQ